jgi:hypothetical protein
MGCLRANAGAYSVGIEHNPEAIKIVDKGGHAADMPAFIRGRLDVCAREVGFDWGAYLAVTPISELELAEGRSPGAVKRLDTALLEQHRSRDRYDAAVGRPEHLVAEVALHRDKPREGEEAMEPASRYPQRIASLGTSS